MHPQFENSAPKLGFFGGSFDPIHKGHLEVALATIEKFSFQQVLICPAFFAPLRSEKPLFCSADRLAMVKEITKYQKQLISYDHELLQEKTCYTYETLNFVQAEFPQYEVYLMLGDDQFSKFKQWKFHQEILEEFPMIIFQRNGSPVDNSQNQHPTSRIQNLKNPFFPHSSSEIRERLQQGLDVSHLLPQPVFTYLKAHNLLDYLNL